MSSPRARRHPTPIRRRLRLRRASNMRSSIFSALLLAVPAAVADSDFRLFHRVYHPGIDAESNFFERGTLDLPLTSRSPPSLLPTSSAQGDLNVLLRAAEDFPDALYQVALVSSDSRSPWDISSVKACHLNVDAHESIILHYTSDAPGSTPYAIDLFVSPIPRDGACPPNPAPLAAPRNTTLTVSLPRHPPSPELRAAPQMSQTGEPVKPPEEKTFFQKYWIYIAIVLATLLLAPGGGEEGQGK
ncbi:hypothetical protein K488DRAFT_81801 [Vararia minispora EC-137]|uniref:Uncharacterized protein n=1 Tax=Vararia minispora EC-137 TaxID=1314806 RepID=A0ACB8QY82_9AGAM|nr:hypothetical protein K488DRAFT_81801 [Vararia minispora EC-137]